MELPYRSSNFLGYKDSSYGSTLPFLFLGFLDSPAQKVGVESGEVGVRVLHGLPSWPQKTLQPLDLFFWNGRDTLQWSPQSLGEFAEHSSGLAGFGHAEWESHKVCCVNPLRLQCQYGTLASPSSYNFQSTVGEEITSCNCCIKDSHWKSYVEFFGNEH